jgi:CubicO group peptidase (beta-lactamase class C family)
VAGNLAHDNRTPAPLDAPFHLGSNTKAMTAVLLATLIEEGRLSLDDRIIDLLPGAQVDPSVARVTVRDVLGHRTGLEPTLDLPGLHAATDSVAARRQAVFEALASPEHTPGEYVYANVNYMLAGVVAEQITAAPWEQLLRERVFEPLDMGCGFGAPSGELAPLGHTADGTPIAQDAAVTDNPPALGPAGTVHCTMQAWGRFAEAMLELLAGRDSEILLASTATDLFRDDHEYVAGWTRLDRDGQSMYVHDGSNTLWYARIVLAPQRGEGLLMASNTGQQGAVDAMDELTQTFIAS